ncbi:hypothetical protein RchiOBHm_Chr4g0422751 [Rosa chinensis]|uniref:Uncharacterized protein n=1 Tax=Rosa chinensis TaxID=74649 RepID=A0A2P6QYN6_ROSCH|nr:hypothetical protein RchiOBHm_Chr4g0422751 [Rosa chinensis]
MLSHVINPCIYFTGLVGLNACVCTLSALFALGRRRVKWLLQLDGGVKLTVVGFNLRRQHSRKVLFMVIILRCNRVTYRVIFSLCHRYVKANRVASSALFASWCVVEYIYLIETLVIISGRSLDAYCNQRFRLNLVFDSFINKGLRAAAPAIHSKKKKNA